MLLALEQWFVIFIFPWYELQCSCHKSFCVYIYIYIYIYIIRFCRVQTFQEIFKRRMYKMSWIHDRQKVDTYLYVLFNLAARWGGCPKPLCGHFTADKEPRYPVSLGRSQSKFRRMWKILPSPSFEIRTVKTVVSGNMERVFHIKRLFTIWHI